MKLVYTEQEPKHSYWLDGKRVKSISKVAQITADRFAIEQYMKRMVGIGFTLDATLRERAAVDLDNKKMIQKVCDDAETAAKSHARADRGTQRHRVLELTLLGQTEFITDQQRNDAAVLTRTLDVYGLEPIAGRVEQFVAWPDHGVVGRYDACLMYQGAPALFDLKGGVNAVLYPHTTLTQCALYLFAPHTSANVIRDGDRSTVTEWITMPDGIDTDYAYVIYCDDDHEVGELWRLDMAHGWAGATLALSIVDWRKHHNYGKKAVEKVAAPVVLPSAVGQPATVPAQDTAGTVATTFHHRRHMLLNRYKQLSPALKKQFRARNPGESDLDDIAALLDELENPPNIRDLAARTSAVGGDAA
jgi:hypothetical protein